MLTTRTKQDDTHIYTQETPQQQQQQHLFKFKKEALSAKQSTTITNSITVS